MPSAGIQLKHIPLIYQKLEKHQDNFYLGEIVPMQSLVRNNIGLH